MNVLEAGENTDFFQVRPGKPKKRPYCYKHHNGHLNIQCKNIYLKEEPKREREPIIFSPQRPIRHLDSRQGEPLKTTSPVHLGVDLKGASAL